MIYKKKFTGLMFVHFFLTAILMVTSLTTMTDVVINTGRVNFENKEALYYYSVIMLANFFSLVCCLIYLLKRYTKAAAPYYKGMILFFIISKIFTIVTDLAYSGVRLSVVFVIVSLLPLIVLLVVPDLGKRNTWILYTVLILLEAVLAFFYVIPGTEIPEDVMVPYIVIRVMTSLARLVIVGNIGLAIKGKYDDKAVRHPDNA